MTLIELFAALSNRGLTVQRTGDGLECRGDQSMITDEMQQALKEHRDVFLKTLPKPMTAAEVEVALVDLREWLNTEMPDEYRLSCNESFWQDFDRATEKAVTAKSAAAFDQLKAKARAEFDTFTRMLKRPCTICSTVPWCSCSCDWVMQVFSEITVPNVSESLPYAEPRPAITTQASTWCDGDTRIQVPAGEPVSILSDGWERHEPDVSAHWGIADNLRLHPELVPVLLRDKVRVMPQNDLRELSTTSRTANRTGSTKPSTFP